MLKRGCHHAFIQKASRSGQIWPSKCHNLWAWCQLTVEAVVGQRKCIFCCIVPTPQAPVGHGEKGWRAPYLLSHRISKRPWPSPRRHTHTHTHTQSRPDAHTQKYTHMWNFYTRLHILDSKHRASYVWGLNTKHAVEIPTTCVSSATMQWRTFAWPRPHSKKPIKSEGFDSVGPDNSNRHTYLLIYLFIYLRGTL